MAVQPPDRKDDDILTELRERYTYASNQWREIRAEGRKDIRYVAGDPWEPKDKQAREDAGRPCLSLDELGQYVNQTINDVRQNKRAINVTAIGNGATDRTANLRRNLIRQIEYRSNAQQAYTAMFEDAVQRSYGFCRVLAKHERPNGFDQELLIEALPNPDLVTTDPDGLKPDGSDIQYAFIEKSVDRKQFKRDYPDAKIQDFDSEVEAQAPGWVSEERIRIAEYWTIEYVRRRLVLLKGQTVPVFVDELPAPPAPAAIVKERWVDAPYVCQYLTNGVELLAKEGAPKRSPWPGTSIPIVACFGKVLWVDEGGGAKRQLLSMIRLARDPAMLYCYYRTAEAEQVGMSTKFPYFIRRGALAPEEATKLAQSLHEPIAFIQVEGTSDAMPPGVAPEMPVRNPFEPAIQALEVGAEGARRAIQAAMGTSPLPTEAQRHNQKSGKALRQMEDSAQKGSYHFVDHYDMAITRVGAIINELIPHYYDAARTVAVRKPDETPQLIRINDPAEKDAKGEYDDATAGDHDVTISVGPAYASEREAASDFADSIVQNPQIANVVGPQKAAELMALAIRLKSVGPIGDEMAEVISPKQDEDGQPSPEQVKAMQAQLQQAGQELQQAQRAIEIDEAKQRAQIQIKTMDLAFQREKLAVESETKIAVAELGAKVDRIALFLEERARLGGQAHEEHMAAHGQAHDAAMAVKQHALGMEAAAAAHENALAQGDASSQNAMAQAEHAQSIAPPEEEAA